MSVARPLVALAVIAVSLAGCWKPERDSLAQQRAEARRKRQMAAPAEQGAVMQAARERRSRLDDEERALPVATIGGRAVTLGEFEERYNELPLHLRYAYGSPDRLAQLLDQVVDVELMETEARRLGLDRDPRVLLPVKVEMAHAFVRGELPERAPVAAVTDAEVRAAFEAHPERYARPVVVTAAHIETGAEAATAALRAKVIEEAGDDPAARVAAFRRLAERYSLDDGGDGESDGGGGTLGTFASGPAPDASLTPPDEVPAALREAALALPRVGALSPVIPIGTRYHVVIATARSGGEPRPLAEVEGTIRARLYRERQEAAVAALVASLREAADVRIERDVLERARRPETEETGAPRGPEGDPE